MHTNLQTRGLSEKRKQITQNIFLTDAFTWLQVCLCVFADTKFLKHEENTVLNLLECFKYYNRFTFVAKRNELSVSEKLSSFGETLTNIRVLLLPPREFCSKYVSLLFRYGM